jgi:muramoyltetrapeptide carboxypeptidase
MDAAPAASANESPQRGETGTVVSIFAPGGYEPRAERIVEVRRYFEARGHRVALRFTPGAHHERFSATDDERLRWLRAVVDDDDAGIAIALRGGYGASRLLPVIDFGAMAAACARGKRFVGLSDFTAIHLGLLATTGATSFAGPLASFAFGRGSVDPFTETHFWRAMDDASVDVAFDTSFDGEVDASGVLWGGNLAMLTSLIGTPWMPAFDGGILFVEDINEQPYRIERMLLQLQQCGILDRQRLVVVGDFLDWKPTDYDDGYDLGSVLARIRQTTSVPIVPGLPFGHGPRTVTLGVGATAHVLVAAGRARLTQRWSGG